MSDIGHFILQNVDTCIAVVTWTWKTFSSTSDSMTTDVSCFANGIGVCHREGLGSVREFTVANTVQLDPTRLDLLRVFTGKATLNEVESQTSVSASGNQLFAVNLFTKYSAHCLDGGAGQACARRHRQVHVDHVLPHWR